MLRFSLRSKISFLTAASEALGKVIFSVCVSVHREGGTYLGRVRGYLDLPWIGVRGTYLGLWG